MLWISGAETQVGVNNIFVTPAHFVIWHDSLTLCPSPPLFILPSTFVTQVVVVITEAARLQI